MGKKSKKEEFSKKNQLNQQQSKQADREYKRQQQEEDRKKRKKQKNYEKTSSSTEDIDFNTFLQKELQLSIVIMRGDGNCLFRSIAHQLSEFISDYEHMKIRKQIVDYIKEKKEYFQLFFDEDEDGDFGDYLEEMYSFGVWGGHFELYAAAQCLFLSIHVYQWNMPKYVIQCTEDNNPEGKALRIIQLSYHGGCHYNSVVPVSILGLESKNSSSAPSNEEKKNTMDSLYVHVNKSLASSEADLIETVQKAVPWASLFEIQLALEWNEKNIDNSIDLLCTNLEALQVALRQEAKEGPDKPDQSLPDSSEKRSQSVLGKERKESDVAEEEAKVSRKESRKANSAITNKGTRPLSKKVLAFFLSTPAMDFFHCSYHNVGKKKA